MAEAEGGTTKPSAKVTPDGTDEAARAMAAATATGVLRKEPILSVLVSLSSVSLSASNFLMNSVGYAGCLRVIGNEREREKPRAKGRGREYRTTLD